MMRVLALGVCTVLASCATTVGAGDPSTVPDDALATCESQCEALDLELDALTVGKRDVSCVCEPDD
jgi:hypothetical protein